MGLVSITSSHRLCAERDLGRGKRRNRDSPGNAAAPETRPTPAAVFSGDRVHLPVVTETTRGGSRSDQRGTGDRGTLVRWATDYGGRARMAPEPVAPAWPARPVGAGRGVRPGADRGTARGGKACPTRNRGAGTGANTAPRPDRPNAGDPITSSLVRSRLGACPRSGGGRRSRPRPPGEHPGRANRRDLRPRRRATPDDGARCYAAPSGATRMVGPTALGLPKGPGSRVMTTRW